MRKKKFFFKASLSFVFKFDLYKFFQATFTFNILLYIQSLLIKNELNFQFITFVFLVFFNSLLRVLQIEFGMNFS